MQTSLQGKALRSKKNFLDLIIYSSKLASVHEVSTVSWFAAALAKLNYDSANVLQRQRLQLAVVTGYCSSAGMGSETILRRSRAAFGNIDVHLRTGQSVSAVQFQFLETLVELMEKSLEMDRIILTVLETLAFLLDFLVLQCLETKSNPRYVLVN
jgi:Tubulin folding cofactor D C terminal